MTGKAATGLARQARPKSRDDTPLEARLKAERWIRDHFAQQGLEVGAIGMTLVKGPIVRFVAQTRESSGPRSFVGTLDVLRGRVEEADPEDG